MQIRSDWVYKALIIPCWLLCLPFPAHTEIYSWKDENNITHFGDKSVEGVTQKKVIVRVSESKWKKYDIKIKDINGILTEKEKNRIEVDVNAVYQFFDNKLYFDIYKTVPVKIRIYKKQEDYQKYLSNKVKNKKRRSRGIYLSKTNEIVVYLNKKERWRTFWTIKHESSHAIVDSLTPFVPSWLNEGLAENMEALTMIGDDFILSPHDENHTSVARAYKSGGDFQVRELLSLSSSDYYNKRKCGRYINQPCAGELIRMLLSTKLGKRFIIRLIHIYKQGSRSYSSKLVNQHYIGGLVKLQRSWLNWVMRPKSKEIKL